MLGAAPRDVVAECPHRSEVCYLRGVLLQKLGRSIDAIAALQSAKELGYPADALMLHLAEAQLAAGEQLQARATLAEAKDFGSDPDLQLAARQLEERIEVGPASNAWR